MKTIKMICASLIILLISSCTAIYTVGTPPGRGNNKVYPYSQLKVPPGHLPAPGYCKIWVPGRPPGHQMKGSIPCGTALLDAPLGAWVITREPDRFRVSVVSRSRRGVVDEIRFYLTP